MVSATRMTHAPAAARIRIHTPRDAKIGDKSRIDGLRVDRNEECGSREGRNGELHVESRQAVVPGKKAHRVVRSNGWMGLSEETVASVLGKCKQAGTRTATVFMTGFSDQWH